VFADGLRMDAVPGIEALAVDRDRFIAGLAHEVRRPLTAVIGMLERTSHRS
jgi:signal transduction histidine kinase